MCFLPWPALGMVVPGVTATAVTTRKHGGGKLLLVSSAGSLLVRGGRVIDPASGLDHVADVLVQGGRVAAVGAALDPPPAAETVDAVGCLVTPGLIDLHTHVYPGLGDFCLHPDRVGVETGVTTVVDAGTSGVATFGLARRWIDDPDVQTRVLAFMDPNQIYFATKDFICHKLEIANDERNLDVESTRAAIEANADVAVGFKVRACYTSDPHISPFLEAAKAASGGRPIMVHLGRFPHTPTISVGDLLVALRPGDVITHAFRGASGLVGAEGKATSVFQDAIDRGVRLDVGHSATDFRFSAARILFDQGFLPTTISTDLNVFNVDHPVVSLTETMSKIWALGVPLTSVIAMVTANSAAVLQRCDRLGSLAPGQVGDVSVLRIEEGEFPLSDGFETVTCERRLAAVGCARAGSWIPARPASPIAA